MANGKKGKSMRDSDLPYLVTHAGSKFGSNSGFSATPFSAPWQRYSKPKYQDEAKNTNNY